MNPGAFSKSSSSETFLPARIFSLSGPIVGTRIWRGPLGAPVLLEPGLVLALEGPCRLVSLLNVGRIATVSVSFPVPAPGQLTGLLELLLASLAGTPSSDSNNDAFSVLSPLPNILPNSQPLFNMSTLWYAHTLQKDGSYEKSPLSILIFPEFIWCIPVKNVLSHFVQKINKARAGRGARHASCMYFTTHALCNRTSQPDPAAPYRHQFSMHPHMHQNPGGGGGGTQLYCCTHARPQVFRTHPKQVLSIGQIYTLFKYFRVRFFYFIFILPPKQV